MAEELKKKENELSDVELEDVSGGRGPSFDVETCPNCSAKIVVFRSTRRGVCNCGYVIQY